MGSSFRKPTTARNPVTAAVISTAIKQNTLFPDIYPYSLKYSIHKLFIPCLHSPQRYF